MLSIGITRGSCVCLVVVAICAGIPKANGAFLDGRRLTVVLSHQPTINDQPIGPSPDVIVGPGVELEEFRVEPSFGTSINVDVDITDNTIRITLNSDQPPAYSDGLRFIDPINSNEPFGGIKLLPETNWAGFTAPFVNFSPGVITVNVSQLSGMAGQQIYFTVIPEPGPVMLAIAGLTFMIASSRRRRT